MSNESSFHDYAERTKNQEMMDEIIQEMVWDGDGSFNADKLLKAIVDAAEKDGVIITDKDEFNYHDYFYNIWQCTEKGLS